MKKILLSGVQTSGRSHIANYFGAMKQFVDLQNSGNYDCFLFLADYHALNTVQDAAKLREYTINLALDYLAIGLDPKKAVLFRQSDVSAHTELCWIFDTLVTVPYLERAHAYKDKQARGLEVNMGTFNYPVLMAADILLYGADAVPVGQDQKQHLEYARDISQKFNNAFGETFKMPEPLILEHVAIIPGTDGQKMSKSYGNTIPLFATREEIQKLVMGIVTDSGGPESGGIPRNVYAIHRLFRPESELKALYEANKGKYKALKEALIEDIDAFVKPMRERREKLAKNPSKVMKILEKGAKKANKVAGAKLLEAKKKIGVL